MKTAVDPVYEEEIACEEEPIIEENEVVDVPDTSLSKNIIMSVIGGIVLLVSIAVYFVMKRNNR